MKPQELVGLQQHAPCWQTSTLAAKFDQLQQQLTNTHSKRPATRCFYHSNKTLRAESGSKHIFLDWETCCLPTKRNSMGCSLSTIGLQIQNATNWQFKCDMCQFKWISMFVLYLSIDDLEMLSDWMVSKEHEYSGVGVPVLTSEIIAWWRDAATSDQMFR
jgi:hypothetical protein